MGSILTEEQSKEVERLLAFGTGRPTSPFEVLLIPPEDVLTVTTTDITRKFRQLSLQLHPDKCPHPEAGTAFSILEKSYNALRQEAVLLQLQRAERKKREQQRSTEQDANEQRERAKALGQKRAREEEVVVVGTGVIPPLGQRSCLSATGVSSDAQKEAEIQRILSYPANSYFEILDVDPESDWDTTSAVRSTSKTREVKGGTAATTSGGGGSSSPSSNGEEGSESSERQIRKIYRRIAQALHPDKCDLPGTVEAFQRVERAHMELVDPKKFIRYKVGYQQAKKKEELLRRSRGTSSFFGVGERERMTGFREGGDDSLEARCAADRREQALKAARLAEEIAAKKKREKEEAEETASLGAMLEHQRKGWKDMMML